MSDKDPIKKKEEDSALKPDPGTTGAHPEEHMEGPISSIVKNIAEAGDEEDKDDLEEEEDEK
ncbi:hypothetical protein MKQ70_11200 [Chitinophaga sedimenti]|uniref:hypothetical protein n=1 Tax=Chitinophaga sedimenti TaxID=2033606 RepID=UPI0020057205|nr:hypothetical protein [Chitinophaga sedimenti]MCK7555543.1 hypothetical protein [Chitinophaga sedimenti]